MLATFNERGRRLVRRTTPPRPQTGFARPGSSPGAGRTFFGSKKACVIEVFTTSRYSSMQDAKLPIRHVENPGNLISVRCRTLPEIELSCRRAGRF
jgi:hypothetical protein